METRFNTTNYATLISTDIYHQSIYESICGNRKIASSTFHVLRCEIFN